MELQEQQTETVQQTLFSLADLTVNNANSVEELRKQLKTAKQMIKDAYANSEVYVAADNHVKGEKAQLIDIKKEIDKQPSQVALLNKAKELASELKEKEGNISDYALEYARMAGVDELVKDGETYDIVKTAKLVKRSQ